MEKIRSSCTKEEGGAATPYSLFVLFGFVPFLHLVLKMEITITLAISRAFELHDSQLYNTELNTEKGDTPLSGGAQNILR